MLRIVDASSRRAGLPATASRNLDQTRVQLPNVAFILLEGEEELLVQLIRDEHLDLLDLQMATLYIFAITDRNRSSLGYFRTVEFLQVTDLR